MVLKTDQLRVKALLAETVTLLCKNGLQFLNELHIEALIGITVDHDEVILVSLNETVRPAVAAETSKPAAVAELPHTRSKSQQKDAITPKEQSEQVIDFSRKNKTKVTTTSRKRSVTSDSCASGCDQKLDSICGSAGHESHESATVLSEKCSVVNEISHSEPSSKKYKTKTKSDSVSTTHDLAGSSSEHDDDHTDAADGDSMTDSATTLLNDEMGRYDGRRNSELASIGNINTTGSLIMTVDWNTAGSSRQKSFVNNCQNLPSDQLRSFHTPNDEPVAQPLDASADCTDADAQTTDDKQRTKCGQVLENVASLPTHHADASTRTKNKLKFTCGICGKALRNNYGLRGHMASRHNAGKDFRCPVCSKEFSYKHSLKEHVLVQHPDDVSAVYPILG